MPLPLQTIVRYSRAPSPGLGYYVPTLGTLWRVFRTPSVSGRPGDVDLSANLDGSSDSSWIYAPESSLDVVTPAPTPQIPYGGTGCLIASTVFVLSVAFTLMLLGVK